MTNNQDIFDPFLSDDEVSDRIAIEKNRAGRHILLILAVFLMIVFVAVCLWLFGFLITDTIQK